MRTSRPIVGRRPTAGTGTTERGGVDEHGTDGRLPTRPAPEQREAAPAISTPTGVQDRPGPEQGDGPTPRRLLNLGRAATFTVFALAGVLFITSALTSDGDDIRLTGRTNLPDLIRDREAQVRSLEKRVGDVRAQLDAAADAQTGSAQLDQLRAEYTVLEPLAGLTPAVGPAVTVTLDDSPDAPHGFDPPDGLTLDDFVVHQQDIEAVVNALWVGGAESMMIMDQRVISTTAVRCVGSVLSLHGRTYSPPYRITAVGDVDGMQAALDTSTAVSIYREYASEIGLGYGVTAESEVTLPAYEGTLAMRWAEAG